MAESSLLPMDRLHQLGPELQALTQAYGGTAMRVFGSVAWGTAGPVSDLDVLVEYPSSPSFEQCMDLKLALHGKQGGVAELLGPADQLVIPLAAAGNPTFAQPAAVGGYGDRHMDVFGGCRVDYDVGITTGADCARVDGAIAV